MHLTHLLYLHGFRSSPRSAKAQQVEHALRERHPAVQWCCPQLPPSPREAAALIQAQTAQWPTEGMAVVGSSLGGFYATWLAERRGCRAAVINPAVAPARQLAQHLGEHSSFHDPNERFFFRPEFIAEFAVLHPYPITRPARYRALIAQGDEVLDWREMQAHYAGADVTVLPGSDHAVSDFPQHLPDLLQWLSRPCPVPLQA